MLSDYFKQKDGFNRLFLLLKKKYESLGRYSGTIVVKNITEKEAIAFSNFFGKRLQAKANFQTSFAEIEKKLKQTKYADFTWDSLFYMYFGYAVMPKKQIAENEKQEEAEFFQQVINKIEKPFSDLLQDIVENKDPIYQILLKRYHKEKEKLKLDLIQIFHLLYVLEEIVPTSLPMLASITGNPHFLDFKTQNSTLFLKLMAKFYQEKEPKKTEEKIKFLEQHKIYVDTLSNYAVTYLLKSENLMVEGFRHQLEPLNLSLKNLEKIKHLDTESKNVYVFENPSILTALLSLQVPIVITSGNPNYIVYLVLEKLINSGNNIYYNGDFDPEGLLIASALKKRFSNIKLFCYETFDYEKSCSFNSISDSRLKKMESIEDIELLEMKRVILEKKLAGYQEKNIKRIEQFIRRNENKSISS